jgi:hypothetical protein
MPRILDNPGTGGSGVNPPGGKPSGPKAPGTGKPAPNIHGHP